MIGGTGLYNKTVVSSEELFATLITIDLARPPTSFGTTSAQFENQTSDVCKA